MVVRKLFLNDVKCLDVLGRNSYSRRLTLEDIVLALSRSEFSFFLLFLVKQIWAIQQGSLTISHKPTKTQTTLTSELLLRRSSAFNYYK